MSHVPSRIPAAIDALIAAVAGPSAFTEPTNVVDGPPASWDAVSLADEDAVSETRYLFIGAAPDDDDGADGPHDFNAAGAVSMDERFTLHNTAVVFSGDTAIKTLRDAAFGIIAALDLAIRNDPSLGQAVLYSRMSGVSAYRPEQYEGGAAVTVVFTVDCRAYLE